MGKTTKIAYDKVKLYIESKGDTLISPEYKNNKVLLDIKCGRCNGDYQQTYDRFKRGYQHAYCGTNINNSSKPKRMSYEEVKSYIKIKR